MGKNNGENSATVVFEKDGTVSVGFDFNSVGEGTPQEQEQLFRNVRKVFGAEAFQTIINTIQGSILEALEDDDRDRQYTQKRMLGAAERVQKGEQI